MSFDEFVRLLKQVERAFSVCGTIEYMAPEIVEGGASGHDKVICMFIFYAAVCSIKSSTPDSPLCLPQCVCFPQDFSFSLLSCIPGGGLVEPRRVDVRAFDWRITLHR